MPQVEQHCYFSFGAIQLGLLWTGLALASGCVRKTNTRGDMWMRRVHYKRCISRRMSNLYSQYLLKTKRLSQKVTTCLQRSEMFTVL